MVASRFGLPITNCVNPDKLQTLGGATAARLSGEQPDYGIQSLFETIEAGKFPSWTVYVVSANHTSSSPTVIDRAYYFSKP